MTKIAYLTTGVMAGVLISAFSFSALSDTKTLDPAKLNPGMYKIMLENKKLRAIDYHLKPGEGGGIVWVSITVDEKGNVISAWGDAPYDPVLKSALEKAARGAKFKPRLVRGHPVKVKATLAYELKPGN